eukprot:gnl/Spiro4/17889_TR9526_c0_g2_i1.p2 gnl/Spiro4/17889_TR9526_c0_g2~~gnl/Spiro4/17889_TR9526_c0_g2_i1.p2  ORF type:complete len:249 (+),score=1.13 gnl/Spiro4/17889_TR9526_c0_g2_i1:603-1349(+)
MAEKFRNLARGSCDRTVAAWTCYYDSMILIAGVSCARGPFGRDCLDGYPHFKNGECIMAKLASFIFIVAVAVASIAARAEEAKVPSLDKSSGTKTFYDKKSQRWKVVGLRFDDTHSIGCSTGTTQEEGTFTLIADLVSGQFSALMKMKAWKVAPNTVGRIGMTFDDYEVKKKITITHSYSVDTDGIIRLEDINAREFFTPFSGSDVVTVFDENGQEQVFDLTGSRNAYYFMGECYERANALFDIGNKN